MNTHPKTLGTLVLLTLVGLSSMAVMVFGQTPDPATLELRLDAASTATPTPTPDADTPPASGPTTPQNVAGTHTAPKTGSLTLQLNAASATPTPVGLAGPEAGISPTGAASGAASTVKTGFLTLTLDAGTSSTASDDTVSDTATTQDEQPGSGAVAARETAPAIGRLTLTLDAVQTATETDPTSEGTDSAGQASTTAADRDRRGFLTLNLDADAATEDSQSGDDDDALKAGDGESDETAATNLLVLNLDSTQKTQDQSDSDTNALSKMTEEERLRATLLLLFFPQGDVNRDGTIDCYDRDDLASCLLALPSAPRGAPQQQLGCDASQWACMGDVDYNGCLNCSDVDSLNAIFQRFDLECQ